MNPRKYITDPKILLEEGKAIMTSSDESKFQLRVFAVIMVLSGHSAKEIGEIFGYTKAAVTGWVRSVDKHGFESLKMKSSPGRPSRLSDEQMQHIDAVLQSNPNDYGFKVWDGPSLSAYIKKEFNIELAVRQCQRIFHKLGFSLIRPQTFPSKGYEDTEKRKEFKKIDEFKVNGGRVLVFQDEVHFQIQTTITSGWFKKGSNPKVKSFPGRFKASFSGFVIPETGELFTSKPDTFNYETTISSICK